MPITASTLKPGSLNLPKLIRHLSHRTDQVKTLSFKRQSKHPKSSKATGQSNSTKGSGSALAGPAVNFGYEENDSTTSVLAPSGDQTYYLQSEGLFIPEAMRGLQQPIKRVGGIQRTGNRTTATCKFYLPSWETVRSSKGLYYDGPVNNFDASVRPYSGIARPNMHDFRSAVSELEIDDVLVERDVTFDVWKGYDESIDSATTGWADGVMSTASHTTCTWDFPNRNMPLYNSERVQFKIQSGTGGGGAGQMGLKTVVFNVDESDGGQATLTWTFAGDGMSIGHQASSSPTTNAGNYYTIVDLPFRDIKDGDIIKVCDHNGPDSLVTVTASISGDFNSDRVRGADNTSAQGQLNSITITTETGTTDEPKRVWDFYFYKGKEWSVDSIKEYSGEYMEIGCSRIRGALKDSLRRTYG